MDIHALALEYLKQDKNPETNSEIQNLLLIKDYKQLSNLLSTRIQFGTAGLRAIMGAGYTSMNQLTVIQTTQGLLKYLDSIHNIPYSIVIGYDHRNNSKKYASLVASVFQSRSIKTFLFNKIIPTPILSFSITDLNCVCGIMITASHNPKQDNGYKLFWKNGSQIIPPIDSHIQDLIMDNLNVWDNVWNEDLNGDDLNYVIDNYYKKVSFNIAINATLNPDFKVCYSAMHGVGLQYAKRVFEELNIPMFIPVEIQSQPDPEFPTVLFPNPEEKNSLIESFKTADLNNCKIVFANDPDADRLAVAELVNGSWYTFTGNEIGAIIGCLIIDSFKGDLSRCCILASAVSSQMLKKVCEIHGIRFEETLTGFKWLGNRACELKNEGVEVLFAFEEAIGFMIGGIVYGIFF